MKLDEMSSSYAGAPMRLFPNKKDPMADKRNLYACIRWDF